MKPPPPLLSALLANTRRTVIKEKPPLAQTLRTFLHTTQFLQPSTLRSVAAAAVAAATTAARRSPSRSFERVFP